jgi:hypothetical protein
MNGIETTHHHGSHRRLIWPVDESAPLVKDDEPASPVKVDAIIVPTFRQVAYLKDAAAAALSLGCPLVTLHSGRWTGPYAAAANLDPAIDLIAIEVPEAARLRLPELETSRLLADKMYKMFERRTDVSTKRNLALVLSHMLRWKRVVFLDDDIRVPNPDDLNKAVRLLDTHTAVGLGIGGFPDNSMVCHAFREAGGRQETFVGGGALAVGIKHNRSFFPNVYNEDWFFVLDAGKRLQPVATVGQVLQYPYDPYRVDRARAEEFGDVLAEGTFWLLDQGKPASDGDLAHWSQFLAHRRQFIRQVQRMVERTTSIDATIRARIDEALNAALGRSRCITPELCMKFMKALATDQERWQRNIQQVRRQSVLSREQALNSLTVRGEAPLRWYTRKTSAGKPYSSKTSRSFAAPTLRSVRTRELQAAIPSPPPTVMPRGFITAKRVPPSASSASVASSSPTYELEPMAKIAPPG